MGVCRDRPGTKATEVDRAVLQECQDRIGYQFTNLALLEQSLTHASVADTRFDSNERLEFLGDAVLGVVVVHTLFADYEDLLEGEMTKIKSVVVSRQTCAIIADDLGLSEYVSLGKGIDRPDGLPRSVLAATLEAIIGAVYLDGGPELAREFVVRHVTPHIEEAFATEHQQNYKSMLQQYAQRQWNTTPDYRLLDEKGPDHSKCFEVGVVINGRHFPSAWGMNKKQAEQVAARRALSELGLLDWRGQDDPDQA